MLKKNILFCGPVFVFLFFVLTPRSAPGARVDLGLANISFEVGHVKRELFWISRVFQGFSVFHCEKQWTKEEVNKFQNLEEQFSMPRLCQCAQCHVFFVVKRWLWLSLIACLSIRVTGNLAADALRVLRRPRSFNSTWSWKACSQVVGSSRLKSSNSQLFFVSWNPIIRFFWKRSERSWGNLWCNAYVKTK